MVKMNNIQETYLALLKAALWGDSAGEQLTISCERLGDATKVVQLASFHGTGPLIYDQLLKVKDTDISAVLRMQMKQQCVTSMINQQSMLAVLSQAWIALENAGIHPVLLKGFALAQYYPQPHLRQWGDIDLYVGQKQYHAACGILQTVFPDADHPPVEDEERKHYNFILPNTVLELHRVSMTFSHPRDRRYYEQLEETYLTKDGPSFDCNGLSITIPEETFNLFFTFLHAWHHFNETGMNMKQLCDIAVLLHAYKDVIDHARLNEMLVKLHLLEVWQLVMYIMVKYLGVQREECPFYSERNRGRGEHLFDHIMSEGSSYKHNEIQAEGLSYLIRKYKTFRSRLEGSRRVRAFAPKFARRMVVGAVIHGIERTIEGK